MRPAVCGLLVDPDWRHRRCPLGARKSARSVSTGSATTSSSKPSRIPKIQGVTCHVSYFDRGVIDRLQKGNWFEDPSDSSIACRQTGPITIGDIDLGEEGEEVFKQGISLIWKKQVVNRIYDKANQTLIYLSHSRQVQDGSAKMSISTIPLYGQEVVWTRRQAAVETALDRYARATTTASGSASKASL